MFKINFAIYAIARIFSFLARFWMNEQYPKARELLSHAIGQKEKYSHIANI